MEYPPIFASDAEAQRAYIACGKVAMNWGPIELALEGFLIKLRHEHKSVINDAFPLAFGRKVKQINSLLKSDPKHGALITSIEPWIIKSRALHAIRTDVVHSICQGTDITGSIIFGKSDHRQSARAGGISYTEARYTIPQIEAAGDEMRQVRSGLQGILLALRTLP